MKEKVAFQNVLVGAPQISKEEFLEIIANDLSDYQWPNGAIECMNPDNVKLVYILGNLFVGTAEGSWSAKVQGNHTITVNNKKTVIKDGTVYSGLIPKSEFRLSVINDNQATPEWARFFCKFGFKGDKFMPSSFMVSSGGSVEGEDSENSFAVWMKNGNKIVDDCFLPMAEKLSKHIGIAYASLKIISPEDLNKTNIFNDFSFSSRDVTVSTRNSITEDPKPIYIPFYYLAFQFEGKSCYIAMMAEHNPAMRAQIPPKDNAMSPMQLLDVEIPEMKKKAGMLKWGWALAILLLLIFNFKIAFVFFIIWAIGHWYYNHSIDVRIEEFKGMEDERIRNNQAKIKKQLLR